MATTHLTWYGLAIEFDNREITQIVATMNAGAAGTATITGILAAAQVTGPAAGIVAIISGLLWLGAVGLGNCNTRQNGIWLHVQWSAPPWCTTR